MTETLTGQDEPQAVRAGLGEVLRSLRQPKVAIAMIFGVATGMPPVMVGMGLGYWLREEGVPLAAIGFMSWVTIFISTKFLWAPFIDRVQPPWLGRKFGLRRSWMLIGQTFVAIGILGMAAVGPSGGLGLFAALAMLTAFASATQDIAVDAWRIESATDKEQDLVAAAYIFGLRGGYFLGSAPLLAASAFVGWATAYAYASLGCLVGFIAALLAREPDIPRNLAPFRALRDIPVALFAPIKVFFQDHGAATFLILPLVALYFVPDGLILAMIGPLYVDLGFAATEIAAVRTVFTLTATLSGVVVAGLLGMRFGTVPVMALAVSLAALSNVGFCLLALSGGDKMIWIGVALFEGFSAGMANASMVAWAGRLTNPIATAAQFALLSSLMTLLGGFFGGFSGLAIEYLQSATGSAMTGFATYFALTVASCIPPLILIALVSRAMKARARARAQSPASSMT